MEPLSSRRRASQSSSSSSIIEAPQLSAGLAQQPSVKNTSPRASKTTFQTESKSNTVRRTNHQQKDFPNFFESVNTYQSARPPAATKQSSQAAQATRTHQPPKPKPSLNAKPRTKPGTTSLITSMPASTTTTSTATQVKSLKAKTSRDGLHNTTPATKGPLPPHKKVLKTTHSKNAATSGGTKGASKKQTQVTLQYSRLQRLQEHQNSLQELNSRKSPLAELEPQVITDRINQSTIKPKISSPEDSTDFPSKQVPRASQTTQSVAVPAAPAQQANVQPCQRQIDNPSSLSLSSIGSDLPTNPKKPRLESVKHVQASSVGAGFQAEQPPQSSIDYDERDFIMSTQEGRVIAIQKGVTGERATRKQQALVTEKEFEESKERGRGSPSGSLVNTIRGLTPQKRLLSTQKLGSASRPSANHESSSYLNEAAEVSTLVHRVTNIGDKERFQTEIGSITKVEPKRSVSASAKKSAQELQQPHNRRAQLLRERKDQIKLQARENSFQRSQKKTDSINRLYARPAEGTKGIFTSTQSGNNSLSLSNYNPNGHAVSLSAFGGVGGPASSASAFMSGYHPQGQHAVVAGSNSQTNGFFSSSLSVTNPQHSLQMQNNSVMQPCGTRNHLMDTSTFSQQVAPPHLLTRQERLLLAGNQQEVSSAQSLTCYQQRDSQQKVLSQTGSTGIEKAKQLILKKMVDWGHNFGNPLMLQGDMQQDTVRTFGDNTQRAINEGQHPTRLLEMSELGRQPTFAPTGAPSPSQQYQAGVFTPQAVKNINFKISNEDGEDQDEVSIPCHPATEREGGEGLIPNPKKSSTHASQRPSADPPLIEKQAQSFHTMQRQKQIAARTTTPQQVTLNPNGHHGVAISTNFQQHQSATATPAQQPANTMSRNNNTSSSSFAQMAQGRSAMIPSGSSAKSTKSLKHLLSGARRTQQGSFSTKRGANGQHQLQGRTQGFLQRPPRLSHNASGPSATQQQENNHTQMVLTSQLSQVVSPARGTVPLGASQSRNHQVSQSREAFLDTQQSINITGKLQQSSIDLYSQQRRQLQQEEEYPCSAFFQNDENFEKAESVVSSIPVVITGTLGNEERQTLKNQSIENNAGAFWLNDSQTQAFSPIPLKKAVVKTARLRNHHTSNNNYGGGMGSSELGSAIEPRGPGDTRTTVVTGHETIDGLNQSLLQALNGSSVPGQTYGNLGHSRNTAEETVERISVVEASQIDRESLQPPANTQGEEVPPAIMQNSSIFAKSVCQSPVATDLAPRKMATAAKLEGSAQSKHRGLFTSASVKNMPLFSTSNQKHRGTASGAFQSQSFSTAALVGKTGGNMRQVQTARKHMTGTTSQKFIVSNTEPATHTTPCHKTSTLYRKPLQRNNLIGRGTFANSPSKQRLSTDQDSLLLLQKLEGSPRTGAKPRFSVFEHQQKGEGSIGRLSIQSKVLLDGACKRTSDRDETQSQANDSEVPQSPSDEARSDQQKASFKGSNKGSGRGSDIGSTGRHEIIAVAPKKNQMGCNQEDYSPPKQSSPQQRPLAYMTETGGQGDVSQSMMMFTASENDITRGHLDTSTNHQHAPQQRLSLKDQVQSAKKDEIIKIEDPLGDQNSNLTEEERKQKKRENSFIRDGYEIYVEGTYIVNGKRKKKVKKRKLSKMQLEKHRLATRVSAAGFKGVLGADRIERELQAIREIGKQTQQMATAQKMQAPQKQATASLQVQSQTITLAKQTAESQPLSFGASGQLSPRLGARSPRLLPADPAGGTQGVQLVKMVRPVGSNLADQVQIPRKLFVKKASQGGGAGMIEEETKGQQVSESPYVDRQPDQQYFKGMPQGGSLVTKTLTKRQNLLTSDNQDNSCSAASFNSQKSYAQMAASASNRSLNYRDPDLQLVTSSRHLTLGEVSARNFAGARRFILHRMIFKKCFAELLKVFKSGLLSDQSLNEKDHWGNTPLLLAAKLSANEEEYLKCINFLFKQGCDGKLRDGNGWSILDEAIVQANSRLMGVAFGWLNIHKKQKIERNKRRIIGRLKQIPDFYCELHWECQSSWIPFLSKLAPSDNFQIWKVGSNIRLDFSLVGFKNLKNKRRRMSILFRNAAEEESDERYQDIDIVMVNRDRQIISNPLEDLDEDEKLAVLTDIMNADPVQNELNITRQEWHQVQNFFGSGMARENVNGYDCSRFKLQIQAQVRSKKKVVQRFEHTYETYFEGAENWDPTSGQAAKKDPASFKVAKDVEKTVESQLWLSDQYPLQFSQFMEVLDTLAISGQASMQKIHEFLENDCLRDVVSRNGFPVKIQVPIGMIVKAMVTFGNFEFLNPVNKEEFVRETFAIPEYCQLVSRKEGMKTMQSKKKRLAVANVVI